MQNFFFFRKFFKNFLENSLFFSLFFKNIRDNKNGGPIWSDSVAEIQCKYKGMIIMIFNRLLNKFKRIDEKEVNRFVEKRFWGIFFCIVAVLGITSLTVLQSVRTVRKNQVESLLAKAKTAAASYDYDTAIETLENCEYSSRKAVKNAIARYEKAESELVVYKDMDKISHIFFHSLIVDTDRAFDGDPEQDGYNANMVTVDEFKKILEQLHANGYVLVSPYDVAAENDAGTFKYGEIRLPKGKKPLIMSQDDVNYYSDYIGVKDGSGSTPVFADKRGDGFASRIVIGEDGYPTCEYMDAKGNIKFGDYDLVPILENFIKQNPDFSYKGARAVLGVTAYEGVLGYRTKPSYEKALGKKAYQKEVRDAKAVADCLKEHGWVLASHSFGHPAYGKISLEKLEWDIEEFEKTTSKIIGKTDIMIFPYGSDVQGASKYDFSNKKYKKLYDAGYRYFFGVDSSKKYWSQMTADSYRGGRINIDGYSMTYRYERLWDFFDCYAVMDNENRPEVSEDAFGI